MELLWGYFQLETAKVESAQFIGEIKKKCLKLVQLSKGLTHEIYHKLSASMVVLKQGESSGG